MRLDAYAQDFNFLLPDNYDRYRSLLGSVMTICTQTIIIFFIGYKMVQIKEKEVYKILTAQ